MKGKHDLREVTTDFGHVHPRLGLAQATPLNKQGREQEEVNGRKAKPPGLQGLAVSSAGWGLVLTLQPSALAVSTTLQALTGACTVLCSVDRRTGSFPSGLIVKMGKYTPQEMNHRTSDGMSSRVKLMQSMRSWAERNQ